jgi:hypothetical protein
MQVLMALIYLFAATCTYWTHIESSLHKEGEIEVSSTYCFTLLGLRWAKALGPISLNSNHLVLAASVSRECQNSSEPSYP